MLILANENRVFPSEGRIGRKYAILAGRIYNLTKCQIGYVSLLHRLQQEGEVIVSVVELVLLAWPCTPAVHTTHTHLAKVDVHVGFALLQVFGVALLLVFAIVQVAHLVVQG